MSLSSTISVSKLWLKRKRLILIIQSLENNITDLQNLCSNMDQRPIGHRIWHMIRSLHFQKQILLGLYIVYCYLHLIHSSLTIVPFIEEIYFRVIVSLALILQSMICIIFPFQLYSYTNICLIFIVQLEHLNQHLRDLNRRQELVPEQKFTLIRIWFEKIAKNIISFDRIYHTMFIYNYIAFIIGIALNSIQVRIVYSQNIFAINGYIQIYELIFFCAITAVFMRIVYCVNERLEKPNKYFREIGLNCSQESLNYSLLFHVSSLILYYFLYFIEIICIKW